MMPLVYKPSTIDLTSIILRRRFCQSQRSVSFGAGSSKDYYGLLGVAKDATQRQIKAAYYDLSKKYHPDVSGSSKDAAEKFLAINEAYECLKDPNRRRIYDNSMSGGGGRYPGDYSSYSNGRYQRSTGNPFYSREYTQAEYNRIWQEFERLKQQQQAYSHQAELERQKAWAEFARQRAARWQEFHQRYPNGPPGAFKGKWEGQWPDNSKRRDMTNSWELLRRIIVVYMACFFVVSLMQALLYAMGYTDPRNKSHLNQKSDHEKIAEMILKAPETAVAQSSASIPGSFEEMMSRVPQDTSTAHLSHYKSDVPFHANYSHHAQYDPNSEFISYASGGNSVV